MKRDQSSSTTSPYFSPRQWAEARAKELDAAHAERTRNLRPTPKFEWEIQRDREQALREDLAKAKREIGRLKAAAKGQTVRDEALDAEIVAAVGRVPISAGTIQLRVEESFGEVNPRSLRRSVARLVKEGRILRVGEGNESKYRRVK